MKYYIIAGEASGDLHGSNLLKSLFSQDPNAEVRFWGGDLMQNVGGTLVKHYKELAFMGFAEVLMNIKTILNNIAFCKTDILNFNPDVILFIDYPGFNMRIAKWAKAQGFKTHYYISPQIWAWKENRINAIKRDIDEMYVILPFEKDYYETKHRFPVHFVGHPLVDAVSHFQPIAKNIFFDKYKLTNKPIIALLPGSRKQEVAKMLQIMAEVSVHFSEYQFVVAGAPSLPFDFYRDITEKHQLGFVHNDTYNLLYHSYAAIVTSGTATLETALFQVPQVVVYKANPISYAIAKRVVKLKYISLVNLIMDDEIVTELIQNYCNVDNLTLELSKVINNPNRQIMLDNYRKLKDILGNEFASDKVINILLAKMHTKL